MKTSGSLAKIETRNLSHAVLFFWQRISVIDVITSPSSYHIVRQLRLRESMCSLEYVHIVNYSSFYYKFTENVKYWTLNGREQI